MPALHIRNVPEPVLAALRERAARRGVSMQQELLPVECAGEQVHDANIVAPMLVHGIETLVTIDVADLERFAPGIAICAPA